MSTTRQHHRIRYAVCAAVTAGLAGALLVAAGPAAAADPPPAAADRIPGGFGSWAELFEVQSRLNRAAAQITAAAKGGPNGLAGFYAAPDNRELRVYWRGPLPPTVAQVVEAQRASVPVTVLGAWYTKAQLDAEVVRISSAARAAGLGVAEVAPRYDGSGVRVTAARKGTARVLAAHPIVAGASVAVEVDDSRDVAGTELNRENDRFPYWAGARLTNFRTRSFCTAGFGVWWQNRSMMLTAAHCGLDHDRFYDGARDGRGTPTDPVGWMEARAPERDVAIVDARTQATMWDGGFDSHDGKAVQGWTESLPGNLVCTSGAVSGVRCGLLVTFVDVSGPTGRYPMVRAEQVDGLSGGGSGDSGGPVFELAPGTGARVNAKGIISAGDDPVPCTGDPSVPDRVCYRTQYYADVSRTLGHFGATLLADDGGSRTGGITGPSTSGDSRADLIVVAPDGSGIGYRNENEDRYGELTPYPFAADALDPLFGPGAAPGLVRFADINGDGRSEHIEIQTDGRVFAKRNYWGMQGGPGAPYGTGAYLIGDGWTDPRRVFFADIDGDHLDEIIDVRPDGTVWAFENVAGRDLGETTRIPFPNPPRQIGSGWLDPDRVRFADINGDHKDEIIDIRTDGSVWAFENVNGLGGFPYPFDPELIGTGWFAPDTRFADLDGDGRAEIIDLGGGLDDPTRAFRNVNGLDGFPYPDPPVPIILNDFVESTVFFA